MKTIKLLVDQWKEIVAKYSKDESVIDVMKSSLLNSF